MIDLIIGGIITIVSAAVALIVIVLAVYFMVEKTKTGKVRSGRNYKLDDQKEIE
ncbi:hypothetical protein KJ918_04035 [Patescibacteria group bacterium]|nr:hypothetical protein [Patescibacteria group bacterium]